MIAPTPLRPDDQVAGGFIPVSVGGKVVNLPELKRARNREWKALFQNTIGSTLQTTESLNDFEELVQLIARSSDTQLDMLLAYDESNALGGREWLDTHATDRDIYEALKKVTAVAFPELPDLLTKVPGLIGLMLQAAMRHSRSTSSSPPNTAGPRKRSRRN